MPTEISAGGIPMDTLKVLMVVSGLGSVGGIQTMLLNLSRELKEKNVDIHVASLGFSSGFEKEFLELGVKTHVIGESDNNISISYTRFQRLLRLIRDFRPHIVHSHAYANFYARAVSLFCRNPVYVETHHSVFEPGWKYKTFMKTTDQLCNYYTHVCKKGLEYYREKGLFKADKSGFIHNGVDEREFYFDSEERIRFRTENNLFNNFVFTYIGRFSNHDKNLTLLLNAFSCVVKKYPHARLMLVGSGKDEKIIRQHCKFLEIEKYVIFYGETRNPRIVMNGSDCLVLSSNFEGFPMVIVEAMACQLPIIATSVGGIHEAVIDDKTGFLVPPKNEKLFCNKMIDMIELNEKTLSEIKNNQLHYFKNNFTAAVMADKYMQLYISLLRENQIR